MLADDKLFTNFINDNLDNSYRFAYAYVKNKQDAEDVVADSVVKALRKLHTLKDPQMLKTWFYRIIINTATDLKRRSAIIERDERETAEYAVFDDYSELSFNDMIKILPPNERAIIVLRFFEDRRISEIAEILQMNENTVKTRLYQAVKKLRIEMEDDLNV